MSKIKSIQVLNLKACETQQATFDGCTAIITGGNNRGKTSFLRGLFDRIRGTKPDKVLTTGKDEGSAEAVLTTGEKLRWDFSNKADKGFREKLTYITADNIKSSLTTALRDKFFPATFDVDRFLQDAPAKQRATLCGLVGLDFTDIDARYKKTYEARTAANTRAYDAKVAFEAVVPPAKIEWVDVAGLLAEKETIRTRLNEQYLSNKKANDEARTSWQLLCNNEQIRVTNVNAERQQHLSRNGVAMECKQTLENIGFTHESLSKFIDDLISKTPVAATYTAPPEPTYTQELPDNKPLTDIEAKITEAYATNTKASQYNAWVEQRTKKDEFATAANKADEAVKTIEKERMDLIKSAKMPEGFTFTEDGIAYNSLAFTREQQSSSALYIAALKLALMNIGKVRCLHFDASFLDNVSLGEIEAWAQTQDCQLLIEMPDRMGGPIQYELINNTPADTEAAG